MSKILRELAKHAMAKKGARQSISYSQMDPLECPDIELPDASWTTFLHDYRKNDQDCIHLPVMADRLKVLRKLYPSIIKSDWADRDGHTYMYVPLDLPIELLKSFIDEAYAICWNKIDAASRLKIELAGLPYDEPKLMARLIAMHNLKPLQKAIAKLARPAILLTTTKTSEVKIPLGATKIGGRPDLPAGTVWPKHPNSKPLAFLAQLDLAQLAKVATPIKGLPTKGVLTLFSAWGWMEDGDGDPQVPYEEMESQSGWTIALVTAKAKLIRTKTPRGVNSFKAAAVKPVAIRSLPNHRDEPPLAAMKWTDDEYDRFDSMQSDFRSIQMGHWLKRSDSLATHHLLGGFALFQQQFPTELNEMGLSMVLQIGTDDHADMSWGDGGELTFYADSKAMAKGRFERMWGTCQGG